ncbi:MAG: Asp/Glu racemase [Pseudomonadota bacterium]
MTKFSYTSIPREDRKPTVGLIVLQSDETLEPEMHQWLPAAEYDVLVSRVPSGEEVTEETLGEMANHITDAARLFPRSARFEAVAYCCTSGTSVIGADQVETMITAGCETKNVTNPLTALVAACEKRNIAKLAFLSPYVERVSEHLRSVLLSHGIESPEFGTFNEGQEAKVAWIDERSIHAALMKLTNASHIDGVFLSCTNLKTHDFIQDLEHEFDLPVLSSNSVLAEHLLDLAGHGVS